MSQLFIKSKKISVVDVSNQMLYFWHICVLFEKGNGSIFHYWLLFKNRIQVLPFSEVFWGFFCSEKQGNLRDEIYTDFNLINYTFLIKLLVMSYMIFSSVNFCINTGFASHSWNILLWLVCCETNFPPLRSSFPYLLSDSEIIIDYVCVDVDFFQASPFLPTSSVCTPSKYFERPRLRPVSASGYIEMPGSCSSLPLYIAFLRNREFGSPFEAAHQIFSVCKLRPVSTE